MNLIKVSTILSWILIMIICVGFVSASDNYTDILSDIQEATFDDIQKNVDNSSTINLEGYYTGDKEIIISKSVTIQGSDNGAVIDGKNNTRAFNVKTGQVTFKNLKFTNCISNNGGAIYSRGSVTLINCTFVNNYAINGGAIYSEGNLTINDSTFNHNNAGKSGGVIYSNLPLKKVQSNSRYGNIIIKDSKFNENYAESGGVIFISLSSNSNNLFKSKFGNVDIENCEFNYNNAVSFGGVIFISGSTDYGKLTIKKSKFNNNFAQEGSALSLAWLKSFKATNSEFNKNKAEKGTLYFMSVDDAVVKDCNFNNNYADAVSSIMDDNSKVTIENTIFQSNSLGVINCQSDAVLTIINGKSKTTYTKLTVLDNSFKKITPITAVIKDFVTTYGSNEKLYVALKNRYNDAPVKFFNFNFDCVSTKNKKSFSGYTNEKGLDNLKFSIYVPAGKYKVTFSSEDWGNIMGSAYITVKKAKTIVKAPKVTSKFKKSNYFKVSIKYKNTKKPIRYNTKVKIKVFTGKKSKTYSVKTNENGMCKLNTKKLSKGKHKVKITSGSGNYKISAKSIIKIK